LDPLGGDTFFFEPFGGPLFDFVFVEDVPFGGAAFFFLPPFGDLGAADLVTFLLFFVLSSFCGGAFLVILDSSLSSFLLVPH